MSTVQFTLVKSNCLLSYVSAPYLDQALANFPTENARIFLFVIFNPVFNRRCCHTGLWASNYSWSDRTCLLITIENFGNTSMAHTKLPRDNTWSDASSRHFNNLESDMVWQRSAIYKHTSKLIDSALTWKEGTKLIQCGSDIWSSDIWSSVIRSNRLFGQISHGPERNEHIQWILLVIWPEKMVIWSIFAEIVASYIWLLTRRHGIRGGEQAAQRQGIDKASEEESKQASSARTRHQRRRANSSTTRHRRKIRHRTKMTIQSSSQSWVSKTKEESKQHRTECGG